MSLDIKDISAPLDFMSWFSDRSTLDGVSNSIHAYLFLLDLGHSELENLIIS